ncbi:HORMA-1 domain-containing protein [Sphingobacterium paramultivorum]|uniref:HORMA-1 domain-containing protein n=1 Tax=Sphingobacterium paramultivorum TaxID=2886510 RepID=UPI00129CC2E6|nr:hypothetical protein [Sphingobacterium paramultivorum]
MSFSYTNSNTQTFTVTHAKYLASKVTADLKRMQRFYGSPSDQRINDYEAELIELLRRGFLLEVSYGFQKDDKWIEPTLKYTARDLSGLSGNDDDPGRIRPNADVSGASFCSYMTYNSSYHNLSQSDKEMFERTLPFNRNGAPEPGVNGYFGSDKSYSSGGKSLDRSSLKSY